MTPVRSKRSTVVHGTYDLRKSLCSRPVDGYIVEPDGVVSCERCETVLREIAEGN